LGSDGTSYREVFEHAPDAILIIEGDRFVDCNPAAVRMLRFSDKDALLARYSGAGEAGGLSAHPADMSPPRQPDGRDSFEKAEEFLALTFEHGTHTFEWEHTCADGEPLVVEVQLTRVRGGDEPVLHVVWRDIGERKRLEAELRRAQRLEAVGRLAGGTAHDFNNLLLVIISHAEQLAEEIQTGQPDGEHAAEILSAADRAADLTRQLLAFSRGQPVQPRATDLGALIDGLGSLLRTLVGEQIELDLNCETGPLTVFVDPSQLEQLVVNLVANARDAMPDGGHIDVSVEQRNFGAGEDTGRPRAGRYVTLTVADSGEGMTHDQLDRAFDPFYTTKALGKGTGLGLATVHAIAEQNGGKAWIESAPGRGSRVHVALPLSEREPVLLERQPGQQRDTEGEETILLVEDEEAIRGLLGRQAIDLLITDVIMPRVSGPELARRLSTSRSRLRVLFMSGYFDTESLAASTSLERAAVIQKPFSPKVLLAEVRRLLDASPVPSGLETN
jgi:signal transduction histidine kinase